MEMLLHDFAHYVALAIEAIAIVIIAIGAVEAVIGIVRLSLRSGATNNDRRAVWLTFARWLVAGLTFQLAADVVNTSFAPTWDELGHLAAIAAIRTFLSYFLDRPDPLRFDECEKFLVDLSFRVVHRPCGAPLYTLSVAFLTSYAESSAEFATARSDHRSREG